MICISEGRFCPSFCEKMQKNSIFFAKHLVSSKKCSTFATAMTKWEVLYGQLLVNPPGLDRSKGIRL